MAWTLPAFLDPLPLPRRLRPVSAGPGARATRIARLCADRVFAVETSGLTLRQLAAVARRELRADRSPAAARLDTLALAAVAAQRSLGMRPHLPQLTAAVLAWTGRAAELPAGEGKTLALALAAVVHALSGTPVHLVHRDDRIATRRAEAMRPLFDALGIPMAVLQPDDEPPARRNAYASAVCYASARDLIFDSLRAGSPPVEPFGFRAPEGVAALLDDLDTILVDGATTPYRLVDPEEPADPDDSHAAAPGRDAGHAAIARTTAQHYFRRYATLGGLAATLVESRAELAAVYRLAVARIGSIYPDFRQDLGTRVVHGKVPLKARLISRIGALRAARRPVLVVAADCDIWAVAAVLADAGIPASLLDALPLEAADAVLAEAGRPGAVTLCACGADVCVALDPVARAAGGLAVVVIGIGPSRRDDRRLRQLCGRQGHPGSIEFLVDVTMPSPATVQPMPLAATLLSLPLPAWLALATVRVDRRWRERQAQRRRRRLGRQALPTQATAMPAETLPCPETNNPRMLSPPHGLGTR